MAHAHRQIAHHQPDKRVEDDLTIRGSDDFLADQGVADPDEFRVKTHLCHEIASIVEARNLTQADAADITGVKQSDVSRIINYRHNDYSVWRLMKMLSALGVDILIEVNPVSGYEHGAILSKRSDQDNALPEEEMTPAPGMS